MNVGKYNGKKVMRVQLKIREELRKSAITRKGTWPVILNITDTEYIVYIYQFHIVVISRGYAL